MSSAKVLPKPSIDSINSSGSIPRWNRPPSPSFSTTTTGSKVNMPASHALITRKDLRHSMACFEDLMAAAKAYRNALLAMSSATAAFATAMEACSRVKGCRSAASPMHSASALQYLVSNHEQLLADTVYRQFEIPLLEALDHYKLITQDRLVAYEKRLSEMSADIRKTEAENVKGGRRRKRDLQAFRAALAELQRQVDELDNVKATYHEEVLDGEDEIWDTVLGKVAFVVRSQLDFYEKLAGKASDPVLEPLVSSIPDPFDSYGPPKDDGQIISVLAPLGMLDHPQSPTPNLTRTHSPAATNGRNSPTRAGLAFPANAVSPSKAETTTFLALGEHAEPDEGEAESRARRELSVIEERDLVESTKEDEGASRLIFGDPVRGSEEDENSNPTHTSSTGGDASPNVDQPDSLARSPESPPDLALSSDTKHHSGESRRGTAEGI